MESVRKLAKNVNMSVINDGLNVLITYALAVNHCSLLKSKANFLRERCIISLLCFGLRVFKTANYSTAKLHFDEFCS